MADQHVTHFFSHVHGRHDSSESEEDSDSDLLSQCSDTAVDYRLRDDYRHRAAPEGDDMPVRRGDPRDRPYDLRPRPDPADRPKKQHPHQRPKGVLLPSAQSRSQRGRFEDALDADAVGPMNRIRKKLTKENRKHSRQKEVSLSPANPPCVY